MKKLFSIVIPVYQNELNLPETVPYIIEQSPRLFPDYQVELILVNDGSPDNCWELMKSFRTQYPETVRIAGFVRNFGQIAAVRYGISIARGDAIGVISADLQDPLELFAEMLKRWEAGDELVCAVRESRAEHGLGALLSKGAHRIIRRFVNAEYPEGGFDFFLLDREVARRYAEITEKNGSMQLQLLWVSSKTSFIPYRREERRLGKSAWTLSKRIKYMIDTVVTNSYLPVRVMSVGGIAFACMAFLIAIIIVIETLILGRIVPGWSSLAVLITFFSGLILTALGIIGEYLWRIYDAVKGRPAYLVKKDDGDAQTGGGTETER